MKPVNVQIHKKQYDDLMRRWVADVSFEVEGHDQPYIATLVSRDGSAWKSNGVRFNPVDPEELRQEAEGEEVEFGDWIYFEGNEKELEKVVEALRDPDFLGELEQVLAE